MPENKKRSWVSKMRDKYRLIILNEQTFEDKISFRLSRLNVYLFVGLSALILITGTTFLIAFTPLREYIPGYTDVSLQQRVKELQKKVDSLELSFHQKDQYIHNINTLISGGVIENEKKDPPQKTSIDEIKYHRSKEDSILRAEFEEATSFNIYYDDDKQQVIDKARSVGYVFFSPLKGIITQPFNRATKHFGIDIVSKENESIKSVLDGSVIFTDWTIETGYVITIQHAGNYISIYKHNQALLKNQGDIVKAGEPIAIIGESGEITTGPHLHFELWHNGTPLNPEEFIIF